MKKYVFEGWSDDTFGEYGITNEDYDNCANEEPIQFKLKMPDGSGLLITGCYGTKWIGQGWMIGVSTLSENISVNWKISIDPCFEQYRNQLTIEAPDEAKLELIVEEEEDEGE